MIPAARESFAAANARTRLPYDAEVEYIEGDNRGATVNAYTLKCAISTGIVPDLATDVWECDVQFVAFGDTAGCWGAAGNRFTFGRGSASWADWYYGYGNTNNRTGKTLDYSRHVFRLDAPARKFSVGSNTYTGTGTKVAANAAPAYLFTRNSNQPTNTSLYTVDDCKSRMFSAKYYRSGVLIQHLIPVRVGTVGHAYDLVTGVLFSNHGLGTLTVGPDKTANLNGGGV